MPAYICTTCGTQYAPTPQPPAACPICLDERQYVTPAGQSWTTLDVLARRNMNAIHELEPGLISLLTFPHFGIGQRAMFLRTPHGNVLWDCIALVDRATIEMINAMGGIKAIAIGGGRQGRTPIGRRRAGRAGQQVGELHVELSKHHPAVGPAGRRRGEFAQTLQVRPHSRRICRTNDLVGRKRRARAIGRALFENDPRRRHV